MRNVLHGATIAALVGSTVSCERVPELDPFPTTGTHFLVGRFDAEGRSDGTFGHGGIVAIDFGGHSRANAVVFDAQRRYVIAGRAEDGDRHGQFAVASLHESGRRNARLDGDGRLVVRFTGLAGEARDLAMDRRGDALLTWPYVAGRTDRPDGFRVAIVRLDETGPAAGFGTGGLVESALSGLSDTQAYAAAVDAASRLVVVCTSGSALPSDPGFFMARYLANGRLDGTFGTAGISRTALPGFRGAVGLNLAIDSPGRHLVSGYVSPGGTGAFPHAAVSRYTPSGALDKMFGTGGVATVVPEEALDKSLVGILESSVSDLTLLDDGRIRVIVDVLFRDDRGLGVARQFLAGLDPNGQADPSFDASGFVPLTISGIAHPRLTAVTTSGERLVVAGHAGGSAILLGLRPDGSLDPAFGSDGVVRHDFPGSGGQLLDVVVDMDDRLVVAGEGSFY
jgi:uncharacterized delta-60 repeat protein